MNIYIYLYIYICVYLHMYICINQHIYMYIHIHIYTYTYICICLYIYIYTYTYLYIYAYTYMEILSSSTWVSQFPLSPHDCTLFSQHVLSACRWIIGGLRGVNGIVILNERTLNAALRPKDGMRDADARNAPTGDNSANER